MPKVSEKIRQSLLPTPSQIKLPYRVLHPDGQLKHISNPIFSNLPIVSPSRIEKAKDYDITSLKRYQNQPHQRKVNLAGLLAPRF
jgi:hypothetical protein